MSLQLITSLDDNPSLKKGSCIAIFGQATGQQTAGEVLYDSYRLISLDKQRTQNGLGRLVVHPPDSVSNCNPYFFLDGFDKQPGILFGFRSGDYSEVDSVVLGVDTKIGILDSEEGRYLLVDATL